MARYTSIINLRIGRREREMLDELRKLESNESELIRKSIKNLWKDFKLKDFEDVEGLF